MVLKFLSEKGRQLYSFILKGLQEGKSGAEILRELRELGEGYRIQDFYNDLRIIKGEMPRWDTLKYVRRDRVISEDLYSPADLKIDRRFLTRIYIEIENPLTGERKSVVVGIGHDTPMRRKDLEDLALDKVIPHIEEYEQWSAYKVRKIYPIQGLRKF
jgi:hypothetical protein